MKFRALSSVCRTKATPGPSSTTAVGTHLYSRIANSNRLFRSSRTTTPLRTNRHGTPSLVFSCPLFVVFPRFRHSYAYLGASLDVSADYSCGFSCQFTAEVTATAEAKLAVYPRCCHTVYVLVAWGYDQVNVPRPETWVIKLQVCLFW